MTPPPRSTPAQQRPPASLEGIPTRQPGGTYWYREHGHRPDAPDAGCWYYASLPTDPATGGRFDLGDPEGTCYFADAPLVAAMERVGRFTAQHKPVPADLVNDRLVTAVDVASLPTDAVDLLAAESARHYGVTGELFTMSDYSVPQSWAAAIRRDGHGALIYTPRFSPGGQAVACFGPAGPQPRTTVIRQPLRDVLDAGDVLIEQIPRAGALKIVPPPAAPTRP